jgi:ArsR family transcriptional regulator
MEAERRESSVTAAKVLGPLSHPTRLLIVCLLMERERYVGELLESLGTTKGNISQHLKILEQAGHVISRKDANRMYYRIADERLKELLAALQRLYCPGLRPHV